MQISAHPVNSAVSPAHSAAQIMNAARSFEAVLLQSLLDSLEKTFAAIPGQKTDQVSDNYRYLGTQALASKLADAGGIGIARMIASNLLKTKDKMPIRGGRSGKV